ncbi:MAG: hypothetical protein ACRENK_10285 [Gemmatimonadaceae bacterium]
MNRRPTPHIEPELYEQLTAPQNTEKAVAAMQLFLLEGDEEKFEIAKRDDDVLLKPSRMHALIFSGILRAFYGDPSSIARSGPARSAKPTRSNMSKAAPGQRSPSRIVESAPEHNRPLAHPTFRSGRMGAMSSAT